jgi:AcrR family transcriptional regulator
MSLQEQHRSVTRDRLLSAAVTVLTQKSLVEATMDEIAKAAGTTRVTLYAHYPGKTEIIRAIADRLNADAERLFTDLAAQSPWTRATLRSWLEGLAAHYEANSAMIRVLFRVGTGALPTDLQSAQERWIILLADRSRWAAVNPEEAHQRVLLAVLNTESFFTTWIVNQREVHTADPLDLFHQMVCYLLAPALAD